MARTGSRNWQQMQAQPCQFTKRQLHSVTEGSAQPPNVLIAGRLGPIPDTNKELKWRKQFGNLTIKMLSPEIEIPQAQELLYDVYIKEQAWKFREGNPTGK